MSGKIGHAGGIPERKVRPIWDAIDSRQYKTALKLSSSLLSKFPNLPYALALKALILERMVKPEEALSVCLEANHLLHHNLSFLMDDLTLSTLQIVFQRLNRLDLATSLYDYACAKIPNNLELMMGLFNCYVREYAYVKQQQTAIKMYKLVGEERFLLWAVCSIQLQVSCGQGALNLLALAEGLLKKHIASHSLHEPEALIVYISVLQQQGNFSDALHVLSGNLGKLILIDVDRLRLQGKLLAQSGDNVAAASTFQKILESCPDDWECFLHYLGCLLEDDNSWCDGSASGTRCPISVDKPSHITDDLFNNRVQAALSFVQKLQTKNSGDPKRGPDLACLEIERRKHLHGMGDKQKFIDALVQYFSRFGSLACFCSDIEVFLDILAPDEKVVLLENLITSAASMSMVPTKTLAQTISLQKVQLEIGINSKLPIAELELVAAKMVGLFCENLSLSKDLDPQECMHGEELLSMACNILVQLYWQTRSIGYLIEAVMILELGLTVKRSVSQYKILLVHIYSYLGALPAAYEWYCSLDVKNILFETVSHQILPQLLISPLWENLNDLLRDYLKFMDDHLRESADLTFLAYRHRNYSKVIEFVQFKERLQHSNQYLFARVESAILRLKEEANNMEEVESIFEGLKCGTQVVELVSETSSDCLTFNEDLELRPWWTPIPEKNYLLRPFEELYHPRELAQEYRKIWETSVQKIVKKRSLIPRLVYLSVQFVSTFVKKNVEANGSASDSSCCLEMKSLLETYAETLGLSLDDGIKLVLDAAEGEKPLEAFGADLVEWMSFAVFLNSWSLGSHTSVFPESKGHPAAWHVINSLLQKCIVEMVRITSAGPLICSPGGDLPVLVQLITEPVAWHCLVLQSYIRSSFPCGKKKKKSGSTDSATTSLISQAIRDSVVSVQSTIEVVAKWLKEEMNRKEKEALDQLLSSIERETNEGPGQVFRVVRDSVAVANKADVGDRIFEAIKSWSPTDVGRNMIKSQCKMLLDFQQIFESKLKLLEILKQQM
ncbi:N-terminal acetyltransferase B complex auxiliary subunit NAA25-like isoform X1 [Silene latifolia]|uniref:N-terminal acetyltransferase B complex auxiliary subunit NAA25-like isoform X1 n=2 Tax=Silene latifolia TaxID=37657 RepID=UPI003D78935F